MPPKQCTHTCLRVPFVNLPPHGPLLPPLLPQFFEAGAGEHAVPEFVGRVECNAKRYIGLFADAASALLPPPRPDAQVAPDVFDVLASHVRGGEGGGYINTCSYTPA